MKKKSWFVAGLSAVMLIGITHVFAEESPRVLPKDERGFVDAIGKLKRAEIVAMLGEPAKAEDVTLKDSGRVVASIWQYHNINVDANGQLYQTTELDIVGDEVGVVVFMNHDGSEPEKSQTYEVNPDPASL